MTAPLIHPWQERGGVPCLSCGPRPGGCDHCRGTGVAFDVQRAPEPRTLIARARDLPGAPAGAEGELWQAGFTCLACRLCSPRAGTRWHDLVVDLWPAVEESDRPRCQWLRAPIPDGELTGRQMEAIRVLASHVATTVQAGGKVMARCQWGLNRSGLLVGLALVALGLPGPEAVALIRSRRSPWALSNRLFAEEIGRG